MAEGVDARELWMPSEFLADDFFPSGDTWAAKGGGDPNSPRYGRSFVFCEFPLELDSNLGSPVEQATDAESDEEDYLAELSRQMAHAFLKENDDDDDDDSSLLPGDYTKGMARSPQSTLCDFGAWSGYGKGSSDGASQVSSPTSTPSEPEQNKDDTWGDLNAAAGEIVRLRLKDQDHQHQQQQQQQRVPGRGLLGTPATAKHSLPTPAPCNSNTATGYFSSPNLTQQQLQAERFYQLKQQQLMKQQQASAPWGRQQNRAKVGASGGRPLGLPSSAWPPLQRQPQHQHQLSQPGSGMRALFLAGTGNRRESSGTGVFLPRRPGNPSDHRKKPACSTVLLPDRVIQALNLNLDDMDCHPRLPGGYLLDHDAMVARGNAMHAQQKWNHYCPPPAAAAAANSHELRLPAEWTY